MVVCETLLLLLGISSFGRFGLTLPEVFIYLPEVAFQMTVEISFSMWSTFFGTT